MRLLKWTAYIVALGLVIMTLQAIQAYFVPEMSPDQKRDCAQVAATADSNVWEPVACNVEQYETMKKSPCGLNNRKIFDQLACYVPTKSEYAKKLKEDVVNP